MGLSHVRTLVVREKTVAETARKRFKTSSGKVAGKVAGKTAGKTAGKASATPTDASAPGVEDDGEDDKEDPGSYFLGTRLPGPAEPFAQLIRGHWGGCEIRNHGTRDVQWKED